MLNLLGNKNRFGSYTFEIEIHTLYKIEVHDTGKNSFLIEFYERGWFFRKVRFSFLSENYDLHYNMMQALVKVQYFFNNENKDFEMTQKHLENIINKLNKELATCELSIVKEYYQNTELFRHNALIKELSKRSLELGFYVKGSEGSNIYYNEDKTEYLLFDNTTIIKYVNMEEYRQYAIVHKIECGKIEDLDTIVDLFHNRELTPQ